MTDSSPSSSDDVQPVDDDSAFEELLEFLRVHRGFDFTGYKRASLRRRVARRMDDVGVDDLSAYRDFLEVHPEEFTRLFNTILINVTEFFRDAEAWQCLQQEVLPPLLAAREPHVPLRLWSSGCASGEEAYTLAIVLAEALGLDEFRSRVKIYATDVDEDALATARHGVYHADALSGLADDHLHRYFEPRGADHYGVRPELRRAVIFGRHDLVSDAPIPRVDLLVCRNTLMYFNVETQKRVLSRLHFAVREDGVLFLGKVEMLLNHQRLFRAINLRHRLFAKVPSDNLRQRLLTLAEGSQAEAPATQETQGDVLPAVAFDRSPTAQIVVDGRGSWPSPTCAPVRCSASCRPTSAGRSRTSSCRTSPRSCARTSSR